MQSGSTTRRGQRCSSWSLANRIGGCAGCESLEFRNQDLETPNLEDKTFLKECIRIILDEACVCLMADAVA